MNKYKYEVKLLVEVEAFDAGDAWDAIQETYGVGSEMGIVVTDCEYREVASRRN